MPMHPSTLKEAVIRYPAEIPQMLGLSDQELVRELRFLGAAKLFELGCLSAAQAAKLADMGRVAFLSELGRIEVAAIHLRDEEIDEEIRAGLDLAQSRGGGRRSGA